MNTATKTHTDAWLSELPLEDRILLASVGTPASLGESGELATLLTGNVAWDDLTDKARWHKLDGMLYRRIKDADLGDSIPAESLEQLKMAHRRTLMRGMYFRQELQQILAALYKENIPVILLKGAALVETVYQDPGVRPMTDLDLLVPAQSAESAQEIVKGLGYAQGGNPEDYEDTEKNHRHLPLLVGLGKPTVVEVHRHVVRLDSPLHFDIGGFWERAEEIELAGTRAMILCPEDQIIHLALNFLLDRRFSSATSLGQLTDISEVVAQNRDRFRWQLLLDTLDAYELRSAVGCTLVLARDLLNTPVPESVVAELRSEIESSPGQLARFARRRMFSTEPFVAHELIRPGAGYNPLTLAWAMFRRLVPSRQYMLHKYGSSARGFRGLRLYQTRLAEGFRAILGREGRPGALKEDLAVDRWMHSLYKRS